MTNIKQRLAERDLKACLALANARRAENAVIRARMQADAELSATLLEIAKRRGQTAIDWTGYFSRAGVL